MSNVLSSIIYSCSVSGLLWSSECRELASSHGGPDHAVALWRHPTMEKTAELLGHAGRILGMAASPDGSTVVRINDF